MANPTEVGAVLEAESISEPDACRLSQVSYADARAEQVRWQMLVFVMGCAFVLSLVAAGALYVVNNDTRAAGAVAFAGTLASGAATAWIVKQRNDASKEKEKALALVEKYCSEPKKTVSMLDEGAKPADLVVPTA